jgi:hypothetical protein
MLVTFADRLEMIATLGKGGVGAIAELGVYKGEFAEFCSRTLAPTKHVLVDLWDYDRYDFVLENAPQYAGCRKVFENYFEGDPARAIAAAYQRVLANFAAVPGAEVIREDIAEAASRFSDGFFDIIYLDGNHTYEYVLRDLHIWFPKLKPGGLFICNDFFESAVATMQNIGVLPAFQTFAKRVPAYPVALSMAEWSDLYFSNQQQSPLIDRLRDGLIYANHRLLELPVEILGAYHHRTVDLSNTEKYLLPSFRADT